MSAPDAHPSGLAPGDVPRLGAWLSALSETLGGRPLSDEAVKLFARSLRRFTLAEIEAALEAHVDQSTWMPRPADIVRRIEGPMPDAPVLVAAAHAHRHPIALPVRAILGADLALAHPRALEARLEANSDRVRDFLDRAILGDYTDDEIARMLAAGIDPEGPIGPVIPSPRERGREALRARVNRVRARRALAAPPAPDQRECAPPTPTAIAAYERAMREIRAVLGIGPPDPARERRRRIKRINLLRFGGAEAAP